jgi:hypothetical protein
VNPQLLIESRKALFILLYTYLIISVISQGGREVRRRTAFCSENEEPSEQFSFIWNEESVMGNVHITCRCIYIQLL